MKNLDKLVSILDNAGYTVPNNGEIKSFMRRKVKYLFDTNKSFKKFLVGQTNFLPLDTFVRVRWEYYSNGYVAPKTCVCGNTIYKNFEHKFCSHDCSTTVSSGNKRGPKVDLSIKEVEFKKAFKSKEFKLVKFGYPKSKFEHSCGLTLTAENYRMLKSHRKCECQHSRIMKHTLESLTTKFELTDWIPKKVLEGKLVRFKNKLCGHAQTFAHDLKNKNQVCHTCHTKYASNIVTHDDYCRSIDPEFEVLTKYSGVRNTLKYKHKVCCSVFKMTPEGFSARKHKCPECAPKGRSSLYKHVISGNEFYVRGKEAEALNWLALNTSINLADIQTDFEKTIPVFKYKDVGTNRIREYQPDLYIAKSNIIIEVKDTCTSGINGQDFFYSSAEVMWHTLCRKAQAVLDAGYKFRVLIFNGDERIRLPKDWHKMSYSQIRKWYA